MNNDPILPPENKVEQTPLPGEPGTPMPTDSAEHYIEAELRKTRITLRQTQIFGVIVLLLVGGELLYITSRFHQSMQPHAAAEIADGIIMQQVNDKGPDFAEQIKQKIPEYIAQTPDYALQELPKYRQSVEDRVETTLTRYCDSTSQQLGHHFDSFLDTHKDQVKTLLTAPNDPAALQQTGQELRQELMGYLSEKPDKGESITDQINQSLISLQAFEKKMHHLATDKKLTPQEKKTRQVIAVLSRSINEQNLGQKAQSMLTEAQSTVKSAAQ